MRSGERYEAPRATGTPIRRRTAAKEGRTLVLSQADLRNDGLCRAAAPLVIDARNSDHAAHSGRGSARQRVAPTCMSVRPRRSDLARPDRWESVTSLIAQPLMVLPAMAPFIPDTVVVWISSSRRAGSGDVRRLRRPRRPR